MEDETNMEALKEHIANLGEKLDRIIGHVGYRQLPDYVEDITLSSQYQGPVKLRGYRYLYLLVSADAVTAMGSSNVLTLDIGGGVTYLQQLKPGWNVVDAPREFRYRVNGLTGAPPALLLHSNDLKAMDGVVSYSGGGVGGSSSNPSYTKLTGSLVPQAGWNTNLGSDSVSFAAGAAAGTVETVAVPIPSPVQKDALYLVSLMNPTGTPQGLTATVGTTGSVGANLAASTTYYYAVSAVGPWGETLISATVSAVEGATAYPIALSWTAQGGATSYNVYKSTTTSVNLLASAGNSTSYTDSGNTATSSTAPPTTSTQGPGTSVTVTFQDAQTFGTSTTYYAEVTSIDVADGVTQAYLVQGWLMGESASQIQVSLDNGASDQAGDVWYEVTQV